MGLFYSYITERPCSIRACLFVTGLHGMKFDGDGNLFFKKWELMNTGTHRIDYENMLK